MVNAVQEKMKKQTKEWIKIIAFIAIMLGLLILAWYYVLPHLTVFGKTNSWLTSTFGWD